MDGIGPNDLNIDTLVQRLKPCDSNTDSTEVIFALPATMEARPAFYLFRKGWPIPKWKSRPSLAAWRWVKTCNTPTKRPWSEPEAALTVYL